MRVVPICLIRPRFLFCLHGATRERRLSLQVSRARFWRVVGRFLNLFTDLRFRLMSATRFRGVVCVDLPRMVPWYEGSLVRLRARRLGFVPICVRGVLECVHLVRATRKDSDQFVVVVDRWDLGHLLRFFQARELAVLRFRLWAAHVTRA